MRVSDVSRYTSAYRTPGASLLMRTLYHGVAESVRGTSARRTVPCCSMSIAANLDAIRWRIESACATVGLDPTGITLIAVSKTQPIAAIREAYEAGQRDFGESRLQEAE